MNSEPGKQSDNTTIIAFVLDESASMRRGARKTVEGFNEYMARVREDPSSTLLHLVTFNSRRRSVVYNFQDLGEIPDLDVLEYLPEGNTPLLDAVGSTIKSVEMYLSICELNDSQIIVTILTDGMENASHIFTRKEVSSLISEKESSGWSFTYLGAGPETWNQGRGIGISRRNISEFDPRDPKRAFRRSARQAINFKQRYRKNS